MNDRAHRAGRKEPRRDCWRSAAAAALILGVLYAISRFNYLVFHIVVEGWSVFVACGIYVLAVHQRRYVTGDDRFRFLGIAYLTVGAVDLLHLLTYKGMGVFPGLGADVPTQLWIVARLLQAVALAIVPAMAPGRRINRVLTGLFAVAGLVLVWSVVPARVFPVCFAEGSGLTPFKIGMEYLLCAILVCAGFLIRRRRREIGPDLAAALISSIVLTIMAELFFTLYRDVYGVTNVAGHACKAFSFYFIFRIIVRKGLKEPLSMRLQAMQEAAHRQEQTRILIEGTRQVLWEWQARTRNLRLGDNWEGIFGMKRDEIGAVPGRVEGLIHAADLPAVREQLAEHLRGATPFCLCEFRLRRGAAEWQWVLGRGMVVERDENGAALRMVGICEDISERKRSEEENRTLRDELAHATRVNTLGQLTASIAHELNQPLAAIRTNAEAAICFLANAPPDLTEVGDILEDIVGDVRRAADFITGMRSLLRKNTVATDDVDLNALLREITGMLYGELTDRHVSVLLMLQDPLPRLRGDRVQIQQVILNLLLNAVDALEDPSVGDERRRVELGTRHPREGIVEVYVHDQGIGLDEKLMTQIFKPFFTTKSAGLGIGLAVTRKIVESHGGQLWATRNRDRGMTFHFTLPATPPEDHPPENEEANPAPEREGCLE